MAEGKRTVGVVKPMRSNALPVVSEPIEPAIEPKVRPFSVRAHWLTKDDCRLDASFYADEVVAARRVIEDSGFEIKMLGDISVTKEIFNLSRFKRIYTNDPTKGYPYLSASEVLMFRPQSDRWIACDKAPKQAGRYFAKEGWLLVTCSGAVGRCVLVTKRLERFFLTHDLLRIIPSLPAGYLYAYLSSWIGQALMVKEQYGMTVTHLEPQHLARLPVPLLPDDEQQAIHEQIMQAYRLRDEANDLLDKADELLHTELGLPRFDESQVPYLFGSSKPKAFTVRATELEGRLDASFHIPIARAVIEQLRKGKYPLVRLGDVAIRIFIPSRFKRIYVSPEYGVPFLQPSHVPLIKPFGLKFISKRANADQIKECTLRERWVVVTRSGTVGRVLYVPKQLDGWVGSDDLIRVVTDESKLQAGYLVAFLMTPYGYYQLTREIYGGVVDHLEEEHIAAVWLPNAPLEVQRCIGTLVMQAFEKKEEANAIENRAIARLENILARGKGNIMPSRKGDAV
jgi:type I restriction enzyme S subunit